jgi:signal transduction histidine kinase
MGHDALRERDLQHQLGWFVRVRWAFVAGLAAAIAAGATQSRVRFPAAEMAAVGALVLAYNVLLLLYQREERRAAAPDLGRCRLEAGVQMGLDLLAITSLVHFAGGAESPVACFYLFHAITGSMLLSRRAAWLAGLGALGLFLSVVVLEYAGVLPHHATGLLGVARHRDVPFLAVACLALGATLSTVIAMSSSIVASLRDRERRLALARAALEGKSHDLEEAYAALSEKARQLVASEKQASVRQLAAGIAREIADPIQSIRGNMTAISEAFEDVLPYLDEHGAAGKGLRVVRADAASPREQIPVLLKDMAEGVVRIEAIVRGLEAGERCAAGGADEEVDLNAAVHASVRLLHGVLEHHRVEEELDLTLPKLRGNVTQVQQTVVNTLQNAAEALGNDAHGTIRIRTRAEHDAHRVRLSIEDRGSGRAFHILLPVSWAGGA